MTGIKSWHAKKAEFSELGESYKKGSASGLADVTNALYENAMSGNPVSQIFFLKNRDPNRWNDVKSINHLQLNVSKMTDSQLLQELKSDPVLSNTFQNIIPQLDIKRMMSNLSHDNEMVFCNNS